jgi:hypothetical protein
MASQYEYRAIKTALESEIAVLEEARNGLGPDSHLRALCDLAAGRVRDLLLGIEAIGSQGAAAGTVGSGKKGGVSGTLQRTPIDRPHLSL